MKSFFCSLASLFFLNIVFAQTFTPESMIVRGQLTQQPAPFYLQDMFKTAVQPKAYPGIDGSPFLYEKWLYARLKFDNGIVADSIQAKLNLVDNKVHFIDDRGEELQAAIRISEVKIVDTTTSWRNSLFRSGYPGSGTLIFQVLADGPKMQVLNKIKMIKWETTAFGMETKKSFQLDEELYFYIGGVLYKKAKSCLSLKDAFSEDEKILNFIENNHLRCDRKDDMIKLATFVNQSN